MKARRVMTRDVVCVPPSTPLFQAHRMMSWIKVRHLVVTTGGEPCGVLSDRDFTGYAVRRPDGHVEYPDHTVAEAMSVGPITAGPDTSVSHVARLMLTHRIDAVPIVNPQNQVVGLITSTDLVELLAETDQESEVLPFSFKLRHPDELSAE